MTSLPRTSSKLEELILYVAKLSVMDPHFGMTKLNKILFAVDFFAFARLGASVTGQTYQKLEHGPAPRGILPAIRALELCGRATTQRRQVGFGKTQARVVALVENADISRFTAAEIDLVHYVLSNFDGETATSLSRWSHDFIGWKAADLQADISYETVFVDDPKLPMQPEELEYAKQFG
ncbi:MAG: Panacea domain-containing protein [Thermoanaerobaculia bacterium]